MCELNSNHTLGFNSSYLVRLSVLLTLIDYVTVTRTHQQQGGSDYALWLLRIYLLGLLVRLSLFFNE